MRTMRFACGHTLLAAEYLREEGLCADCQWLQHDAMMRGLPDPFATTPTQARTEAHAAHTPLEDDAAMDDVFAYDSSDNDAPTRPALTAEEQAAIARQDATGQQHRARIAAHRWFEENENEEAAR